ncbi:MAG: DNA polymerase-3 subunit delta [Halieaceae bacterium]|jgi:DNA polymerase-3 subunit delta
MRLYPEKLAQDLARELRPIYLISGDETLLVQECADQVRAAARAAGCSERCVLDAGERSFDWQDLRQNAGSLSLFAQQRLLELRIPSGKPGSDGSKALCEYLADPPQGDVLLVIAGKIDKASTNSKWHKAIDSSGATVQLWPVNAAELPRWLEQRAAAKGLRIEREALSLLAERVEGNLLAAVQELEKLQLIAGNDPISTEKVADVVADSARFNLFALLDVALAGKTNDSLRMLHGLRSEGSQPAAVLWGLNRELRLLQSLLDVIAAGRAPSQALAEARVWKNRQPILQAALSRHSTKSSNQMLILAGHVDGCIKGYAQGDPWEAMECLLLALTRRGESPLPLPA